MIRFAARVGLYKLCRRVEPRKLVRKNHTRVLGDGSVVRASIPHITEHVMGSGFPLTVTPVEKETGGRRVSEADENLTEAAGFYTAGDGMVGDGVVATTAMNILFSQSALGSQVSRCMSRPVGMVSMSQGKVSMLDLDFARLVAPYGSYSSIGLDAAPFEVDLIGKASFARMVPKTIEDGSTIYKAARFPVELLEGVDILPKMDPVFRGVHKCPIGAGLGKQVNSVLNNYTNLNLAGNGFGGRLVDLAVVTALMTAQRVFGSLGIFGRFATMSFLDRVTLGDSMQLVSEAIGVDGTNLVILTVILKKRLGDAVMGDRIQALVKGQDSYMLSDYEPAFVSLTLGSRLDGEMPLVPIRTVPEWEPAIDVAIRNWQKMESAVAGRELDVVAALQEEFVGDYL
jgi:hypothetical protein